MSLDYGSDDVQQKHPDTGAATLLGWQIILSLGGLVLRISLLFLQ